MAAIAVTTALVLGMLGTSWGMLKASRAAKRASDAAERARLAEEAERERANEVEQVAAFQAALGPPLHLVK